MTADNNTNKGFSVLANRFLYISFVILGLYYALLDKDPGMAISTLGLALAFDPFNQNQPWSQRPLYQRIWLILHLCALIVLAVYLFK